MTDFRYSNTARQLEDDLVGDLQSAAKEAKDKATKHEPPEEEHALDRIAKGKTPLDEVKALIDASTHKSAEEEIREFGVRRKLAAIKARGPEQVDSFLTLATKET